MRLPFAIAAALMLACAPLSAASERVDALLETGMDAQAFAAAQDGAAAGDAELTGYLGWFYDNGRHVARDRARAAQLFRQAADGGDAYSQWRLAVMIDEGLAPGTLGEAVALFRRSAAQKNSDGMVGLAVMHATGRGVARDFDATMRYYQAAARMGNAHGLQGIGVLYANGEGVAQDLGEAVAFWLVASAAGDESSDELLAEFMPRIDGAAADTLLARADAIARSYNIGARFEVTAGSGI